MCMCTIAHLSHICLCVSILFSLPLMFLPPQIRDAVRDAHVWNAYNYCFEEEAYNLGAEVS